MLNYSTCNVRAQVCLYERW